MASEYLKWKYRDVKPDPPPRELTRKEKIQNWWHYNWFWPVLGVFLVWVVGSIVWNALGIGQIKPDYMFAYVGESSLPGDCVEALERELALLGEDVNGDGQVKVTVRQYPVGISSVDEETSAGYAYANTTALMADIQVGESYFFLTPDPEYLQTGYEILADQDGNLPERGDTRTAGRVYQWKDCPVLAGLDLGDFREEAVGVVAEGNNQELLQDMYIGRRGFVTDKAELDIPGCEAFWKVLMEGAKVS